jgi:hypothetical protein
LLNQFGSDTDLLEQTLRRGLTSRAPSSFPYLRLIIEQSVGAPEQTVDIKDEWSRKLVNELHPGPPKGPTS